MPPPGHIVFLKGADGKLVAHPADVVGDGTVVPLLLRDPLVEGGHLFGVPHVVLIKGLDHLVHLLFLVLAHLVHIHRAVHEGFQHPESLVLHRAGLDHGGLGVGQDAVDHGGDPLRLGLPQHVGGLFRQQAGVQHAGPDRILDVVVDIGDLVGHPDDPAFGGGGPGPFGVGDDAVAHLPGQVEAPAVLFQPVHHPQALFIVLEAAGAQGVQRPLPCVAERGVAQVVGQGHRLGQVLVEAQGPGDGPGDLGHLQRMGQPGAVEVPLRREKDLGLLLQPPERLAVDDPVPVPLVDRPEGVLGLGARPAAAPVRKAGPGRQGQVFDLFRAQTDVHSSSLTFHFTGLPVHILAQRVCHKGANAGCWKNFPSAQTAP